MAKKSAHGNELYLHVGITSKRAYMSDGQILINRGMGWKLHAKVKDGINPIEVANNARQHDLTCPQRRPAYYRMLKLFQDLVSFTDAWKVLAAIEVMPDDADGVWSALDDEYSSRGRYSIEDIVQLCEAYRSAQDESRSRRESADHCWSESFNKIGV